MNPLKKLVLCKWGFGQHLDPLKEQLRRTCRKHQIAFNVLDRSTPHYMLVNEVRDADYCVVWHGSSPLSTWAVETRKHLKKHVKVIEVGWFSQTEYWHVDDDGIGGKSSMCGKLPEPSEESWEKLEQIREKYRLKVNHSVLDNSDLPDKYILVPLQITHDSTVYLDAPYKFSNDFINAVSSTFSDHQIVIKTHPKNRHDSTRIENKNIHLVKEGLLIDYTPRAELVFGQTSTSLLESVLLGVPTRAIGKCPLYYHQDSKEDTEKLLATMVSRQIPRNVDFDMWKYITN